MKISKINILLINPWIADFAAFDFWMRPAALLRIGAVLRNQGIETNLIDCLDRYHPSLKGVDLRRMPDGSGNFLRTIIPTPTALKFVPRRFSRYGITLDAFREDLKKAGNPSAVLITSSMTYWYPGVLEAISIVKEMLPGAPVVLGGRYAALCRSHAEKYSGADFIHSGPFDSNAAKLLSYIFNTDINVPEKLQASPIPAHDLYPCSESAAIAFSSGCPYRCTYCVSHKLHPDFQQVTPESAMEEIRILSEDLGIRHISFIDDALLVNSNRLFKPVIEYVIEKKFNIGFHIPNAVHSSLITPEIAELMARACFSHIRLGLEAANASFHETTGGKTSSDDFKNAVVCLKTAGVPQSEIGAYIISGHPNQTMDEIHSAIILSADAGAVPILAEYSPVPFSADFKTAVETFRRPPDLDPLLQNSSIINFQHPLITLEEFSQLKQLCVDIKKKLKKDS